MREERVKDDQHRLAAIIDRHTQPSTAGAEQAALIGALATLRGMQNDAAYYPQLALHRNHQRRLTDAINYLTVALAQAKEAM
jgi:hypothetical protein